MLNHGELVSYCWQILDGVGRESTASSSVTATSAASTSQSDIFRTPGDATRASRTFVRGTPRRDSWEQNRSIGNYTALLRQRVSALL